MEKLKAIFSWVYNRRVLILAAIAFPFYLYLLNNSFEDVYRKKLIRSYCEQHGGTIAYVNVERICVKSMETIVIPADLKDKK